MESQAEKNIFCSMDYFVAIRGLTDAASASKLHAYSLKPSVSRVLL